MIRQIISALFIIAYLISSYTCLSQEVSQTDSLLEELNTTGRDSKRVNLLIEIGSAFESRNADSALHYYFLAGYLADELGDNITIARTANLASEVCLLKDDLGCAEKSISRALGVYEKESLKDSKEVKKLKAASLQNMGVLLRRKGNPLDAIPYHNQALEIFKGENNQLKMAACIKQLGNDYYYLSKFDTAAVIYKQAAEIYEKLDNKKGMSSCYNNIGIMFDMLGEYYRGIESYEKALEIDKLLKDTAAICADYNNLGVVHIYLGNFDTALEYYQKSLDLAEGHDSRYIVSLSYLGISNIHIHLGNFKEGVQYCEKALELKEQIKDNYGISDCYNNFGVLYRGLKEFDKSIEYYQKALEIKKASGDIYGQANALGNIGNVNQDMGKYQDALNYQQQALVLRQEISDRLGVATCYNNISQLNIILSDSAALTENQKRTYLNKAVEYGQKALKIAQEIKSRESVFIASSQLKSAYVLLGRKDIAYDYAELYIEAKDSMISEAKNKAIHEMEAKYQSVQRKLEIENLEKDKALQASELEINSMEMKRQRAIIYSFILGFVIIITFSILLLRLFLQKKKANRLLAKQNDEITQKSEEISSQRDEIEAQRDKVQDQKLQIENLYNVAVEQKEIVEHQKEEIEASITYARRIQRAVLPAESYTESILGEHFILFRPKDIVSGDFYWIAKVRDQVVVTVADCTGHGVPGAFMSMLGVSFLNEIVRKKEVTKASHVLDQLRTAVIEALSQKGVSADMPGESGTQKIGDYAVPDSYQASSVKTNYAESDNYRTSSVKDGMDMSLCVINSKGKEMQYAGANNPAYILRNEHTANMSNRDQSDNNADAQDLQLEEVKPDKMPVSVHVRMDEFTNHVIKINPDDRLYLFSDGYPDQFGGPKGKKFKYKPFKNLLIETSRVSMAEQHKLLETSLDNWMNYGAKQVEQTRLPVGQVDDITILGIKI